MWVLLPLTNQGKNMNKTIAPKLSTLPFLKHFESYVAQIFVHTSALYVGGGGHSRISAKMPKSQRHNHYRSKFKVKSNRAI